MRVAGVCRFGGVSAKRDKSRLSRVMQKPLFCIGNASWKSIVHAVFERENHIVRAINVFDKHIIGTNTAIGSYDIPCADAKSVSIV